MRAVTVSKFGGPEALEITEVPTPEPGAGEVRVKVVASAVNPIDVLIRNGALADALPQRESYTPGLDFAGEIDVVGDGVTQFSPGQRVVGLSPWFESLAGTYAEFVVVPAAAVAAAPQNVEIEAAATLPLNGITASLAVEAIALTSQDTVLVTGAAGGVGGYAVELASTLGATVVAVAGADDKSLVLGFGASNFVDRDDDIVAKVAELAPNGVDAVIDAASLGAKVLPAVKNGGRFAAVLAHEAPASEREISVQAVQQAPDGALLASLVEAVEAGRLTLRVAGTFPLADAGKVHERLENGGVRGRMVLVP